MYDELATKVHSNAVKVPSNSELVFKCDSDKENLEEKKRLKIIRKYLILANKLKRLMAKQKLQRLKTR